MIKKNILLLFVVAFVGTTSAQITITGSTLNEATNYTNLNAVFTALNATGANSQSGKDISITISESTSLTASVYIYDRGWNHLSIKGNGHTITGNAYSIVLGGGKNISFVDCGFISNASAVSAIHISSSSVENITFDKCSFTLGGENGIFIAASASNITVKNSVFTKNITSYRTSGEYRAIFINSSATNTLIQNNEFRNLLRSETATNVIRVNDLKATTLLFDGNSFYETQAVELPSGWSRYLYIGGGFGGGIQVEDLRIKNNYFGSTAAKGKGSVLSLGTTAIARNFICVETSTYDQLGRPNVTNIDSIIGNHFVKISMKTSSGQSPSNTEEKRGALTAYYNYFAGRPQIINNTVSNFTLIGSGNANIYLVGLAHTGSEPNFESNRIENLNTNHDDSSRSGSISAICLGAVNVASQAEAKYITFKNNLIDGLNAGSTSTNNAQHVIGIHFMLYGGIYEGPCSYVENTVRNIENKANSSIADNYVAGLYSEHNGTAYRKVYKDNSIENLSITNTRKGISSGIYFAKASSSYIEGNTIRNIKTESITTNDGALYGIYTSINSSIDTILNNRIYDIASINNSNGEVVGLRLQGTSFSYNNLINIKSVGETIGIRNSGSGSFYNNVIYAESLSNSLTYGIYDTNASANYYHNTVCVYSVNNSSAAYRGTAASVVKNNIFDNRGNNGYAFYNTGITAPTANNNYYSSTATYYNNGTTQIPFGSSAFKPWYRGIFIGNAISIEDFQMQPYAMTTPFQGIYLAEVKSDIGGNARSDSSPIMGAWEKPGTDAAEDLFVNSKVSDYSGDGTTWEKAFKTISQALNVSNNSAFSIKNIYVAEGIYHPETIPVIKGNPATTLRDKTFEFRKAVKIYGAYPDNLIGTQKDTLLRDFKLYETILSGDLDNNDILSDLETNKTDNSYHVVMINTASDKTAIKTLEINGFTISGGYSADRNINETYLEIADGKEAGAYGRFYRQEGAGIVSFKSPYKLINVIIKDNVALIGGGISNRTVDANYTRRAIYDKIYFTNNRATRGAILHSYYINLRISDFNMTSNITSGNMRSESALYSFHAGMELIRGRISGNLVKNSSALICFEALGGGTPEGNYELINSLVSGNTGEIVISLNNNIHFKMINSTIAGNQGFAVHNELSTGAPTSVYNSIIYGNLTASNLTLDSHHSLIQGYPASESNKNINGDDPKFVNAIYAQSNQADSGGDFRLQPTSPAIYKANKDYVVNFPLDLDGNPRWVDNEYVDMGAYQQNLLFWMGSNSNDWDTANNWLPKRLPKQNENLYFHSSAQRDLHVNPATERTQDSIFENTSGRKLIVVPNSYLKVSGGLQGFNENNFIIQANEALPNGTFVFPQGQTQRAQVQLYSKAVTEEQHSKSKYFKWQYFTSPVASYRAENLYGSWLREYNETYINNRYWTQLKNSDLLYPFKGYEISRKLSTNATGFSRFAGELINNDHTLPVTYTETANPYKGKMVTGNPYTAPLDIKVGLDFAFGMDNTIYLFNAGSSEEWHNIGSASGIAPGQYLSVPQAQAGIAGLPSVIPSLQGFVVKVQDGYKATSNLTFKYSGVSKDNALMRSKDIETSGEKTYTIVKLSSGEVEKDMLWLFVDKNSTRDFDNGYDGRKMSNDSNLALIYASEKDGNYQVNTIPNINGTYLSVQAEESTENYTLIFSHSGRNADEQLFLLDLKTDILTDISADGTEYNFYCSSSDVAEKRFLITSRPSVTTSTDEEKNINLSYINGNVILENRTENKAEVSIFDSLGRKALVISINSGESSILPSFISSGVYILKMKSNSFERLQKIIIN